MQLEAVLVTCVIVTNELVGLFMLFALQYEPVYGCIVIYNVTGQILHSGNEGDCLHVNDHCLSALEMLHQ